MTGAYHSLQYKSYGMYSRILDSPVQIAQHAVEWRHTNTNMDRTAWTETMALYNILNKREKNIYKSHPTLLSSSIRRIR